MTSCAVSILFKRFWRWRMKEFPEFATFCGVHDYDGELQSYSEKSLTQRLTTAEEFLSEAEKLVSEPTLSEDNKLNLEYFIFELKTFIEGYKFKGYYFPLCFLDGVHLEFGRLLESMKKDTEEDYKKFLKRISNLNFQIKEIRELMQEGIANGMTLHKISIAGVLEQLDVFDVDPEESILFKPFESIPESFSINFKADLLREAKESIKDVVLSFKNLKQFLEEIYLEKCRSDISISSLPGGKEFYQGCLNYHLTCTMSPNEVHKVGLAEVERIKEKMEKAIQSLGLKMSVKEFSEHIRENDKFSFKNVEEIFEAYNNTLFSLIEPKLHKLFNYKPRSKLEIKSFPASQSKSPAAFYFAGTFDGSRPGLFYLNTADLKASPKYSVVTLALHEGLPGHHFQMSYLMESESPPEFRRYLEDRRYTEAPSLFPFHTAYVEGWGLYSEYLGYELGLYDDPYMEFGHLSYEMLRACRLVVDTGMHVLGWSRDQAVEYMLDHTAEHRTEIENEVNRYITWPGQACGYKIGELKIKSLRKKAEEDLGPKFDVQKFHDLILQSFGPLDILERRVFHFIDQEKINVD